MFDNDIFGVAVALFEMAIDSVAKIFMGWGMSETPARVFTYFLGFLFLIVLMKLLSVMILQRERNGISSE